MNDVLEALVADLEEHELEPHEFGPVAREAVDYEEAFTEWLMEATRRAQDEEWER